MRKRFVLPAIFLLLLAFLLSGCAGDKKPSGAWDKPERTQTGVSDGSKRTPLSLRWWVSASPYIFVGERVSAEPAGSDDDMDTVFEIRLGRVLKGELEAGETVRVRTVRPAFFPEGETLLIFAEDASDGSGSDLYSGAALYPVYDRVNYGAVEQCDLDFEAVVQLAADYIAQDAGELSMAQDEETVTLFDYETRTEAVLRDDDAAFVAGLFRTHEKRILDSPLDSKGGLVFRLGDDHLSTSRDGIDSLDGRIAGALVEVKLTPEEAEILSQIVDHYTLIA